MSTTKNGRARLAMRHRRVRQRVAGRTDRPRMAVFRSLNHIYAQVIDDGQGHTIATASSLDLAQRPPETRPTKTDISKQVGSLIAKRAKDKGVTKVVLDRGGNKYHGRVKALADAAREEGLEF
jgi:large subunit ribosomal protein L18